MNDHSAQHDQSGDEVAWDEIELLLDEVSELVKTETSAELFQSRFLARIVQATAALGGCIWVSDGATVRAATEIQTPPLFAAQPSLLAPHADLMARLFSQPEPQLLLPGAACDSATNDTPWLLVVCPVRVEGEMQCVVELVQRADERPSAQRGYQKVLLAACELAEEFFRRQQIHELRRRETWCRELLGYSEQLNSQQDAARTAYTIANEARALVAADRVGVLRWDGSQAVALCLSGVAAFDRRAESVRRLELLTSRVLRTGDQLWYPAAQTSLAPELENSLQAYLDEAHVRAVAIVPLYAAPRTTPQSLAESAATNTAPAVAPQRVVGALVAERFDAATCDDWQQRVLAVARPSGLALAAALEFESVPLARAWRRLHEQSWFASAARFPKIASGLLLLAAMLLGLVFVPADFTLFARGEIQPRERVHIFAPADGVVTDLLAPARLAQDAESAAPTQQVQRGERLAQLTNPQLDLQFSEVVGKRRTTQEELNAAETELLKGGTAAAGGAGQIGLSTRIEQLKQTLQELEREQKILADLHSQLDVRSPLSGTVLTWDVTRLLAARPVQRGDRLMTVANLDGDWELELTLADTRLGHLQTARREWGDNLRVTFLVANRPGVELLGTIRNIAEVAEVDDDGTPIIRVTVAVQLDEKNQAATTFTPGASVVARIHCGRRSIGFVWLHELWEAMQRRLFF